MQACPPVSHGPEFWSAIASAGSAVAAVVSLIGLAYTSLQNRRSADAAEAAVLQSIQPVLTPRLLTQGSIYRHDLAIEVTNAGRGVATTITAYPTSESDVRRWKRGEPIILNPQIRPLPMVFADQGHPLAPNGKTQIVIDGRLYGPNLNLALTCADERGNMHLCLVGMSDTIHEPITGILMVLAYGSRPSLLPHNFPPKKRAWPLRVVPWVSHKLASRKNKSRPDHR